MTRYLHSLSATLFYLLGTGFFLAYVLSFNNIAAPSLIPAMHSAVLPLLCVALLYGGTSVYLSLTNDRKPSRGLGITLTILLTLFFLTATTLSFWPTPFVINS